jgi:hypothetical protein
MLPARPPPPPPVPITLAKLLLVEGDTPMHFFEALLKDLGLHNDIEIRKFGGVGDFKTFLVTLASTDEFQRVVASVGVIRDAEDKPAAQARAAVEYAFTAAGLTSARTPAIRTAVFILPDDTKEGMIETLCMEAVKGEPTLAAAHSCVEEFFACLTRNGISLPALPKLAKNKTQAYLATRMDVQMFPGIAASRGHWPFTSPVFDPLKQFLRSL